MTGLRFLRPRRRGVSMAQWLVLVALIALGVVAAVRTLGTRASTSINTTSGNVANPATLPARFGSGGS